MNKSIKQINGQSWISVFRL